MLCAFSEYVKAKCVEVLNKSSSKRRQVINISYDITGYILLNKLMR